MDFRFSPEDQDSLLDALSSSGHGLLFTGKYEKMGLYIFVPVQRLSDNEFVNETLHACVKPTECLEMLDTSVSTDKYVVLVHAVAPRWSGLTAMACIADHDIKLASNRLRVVSHRTASLVDCCNCVQSVFADEDLDIRFLETRANNHRVHDSLREIEDNCASVNQALVEGIVKIYDFSKDIDSTQSNYTFAAMHCSRSARLLTGPIREQLHHHLVTLAINWIHFICSLDPNDRRTFKWAVKALEFTLSITSDGNILFVADEMFRKLRDQVAKCISIIIGQFGGSGEIALNRSASSKTLTPLHQISVGKYHTRILDALTHLDDTRARLQHANRLAGRVLDDQQPENSVLVFLASTRSNVSLRWQKSRFLGSGSFGSVYLAIDLDSGNLLAMKEIKFQDFTALNALHKSIKEEMSVMERLHHPNIVSYYGIEVHRDRVYIFMEYCPGGSVADLVRNGRIEDEEWIQIHTIQMLRGLHYLHSQNIVHRYFFV